MTINPERKGRGGAGTSHAVGWVLCRGEASGCSEGEAAKEKLGVWEQGSPFPTVLQRRRGEAQRV